jgi:hypothetical protein
MRLLPIELVVKRSYFVTLFGAFLYCFSLFYSPCLASERLFSLQIGPTWPTATSSAWNAELMFGTFVDKKVGFGIAADFLWNTLTQEADAGNGQMRTIKDESSYMYPIMGFIVFDPMPYQIIHPLLKFEIGYNSLQYHVDPAVLPDHPGYYYGMIVKLGIDGLYNLGEQAAIFLGLEYQWADTKTTKDGQGFFSRRDMSGTGLSVGFRFLL